MKKSSTNSGFRLTFSVLVLLAMMQLTMGTHYRLCGTRLREALGMLCEYGFNGHMTKRSSLMPEDEGENFDLSLDLPQYFTSMEANTLAKIRRRRHYISHECCDKSCSKAELMSYCRDSPAS